MSPSKGEWTPPWRPGLPHATCPAQDCRLPHPRTVVAITMTRGHCADCARRLGLSDAKDPERAEQLSLGVD